MCKFFYIGCFNLKYEQLLSQLRRSCLIGAVGAVYNVGAVGADCILKKVTMEHKIAVYNQH